MENVFTWGAPSLVLLVGLVDDLKMGKVPNRHILILLVLGVIAQILFYRWVGLQIGLLGFGVAAITLLPLVSMGVVGAGDLKLMLAFGMVSHWSTVLSVLIWSLVWGAVLGLIRAIVAGEFKNLMLSTVAIVYFKKAEINSLHKIPFAAALCFGWITVLALSRWKGSVLW